MRSRRRFSRVTGVGLALFGALFGHQSLLAKQDVTVAESEVVRQRWDNDSVTIVLDESLKVLGPDIHEIVESAFRSWEETGAKLPALSFEWGDGKRASLKPDGQSSILVAPIEFEGHESDLAITIGFSNPKSGEVSEADIVINSKHIFSIVSEKEAEESSELASSPFGPDESESCSGNLDARACGESYDLQNVLSHEVGHFLGLGENYDDPTATMFSCTSACEVHKRNLEDVDVDAIVALYASRTDDSPVNSGCTALQIGGESAPKGKGALAFFLLSLFVLRRRSFQ